MNYLDFDLLIEKNATGYRAKVINSPAGQASQAFSLPFSALELANFVLRLGHLRHGMRRIESPGMEAAKEFGGKLFNALFTDDVKSCWQSSLNDAARNHAGLRLRLRLSEAPELLDVPWEFLYHASLNRFLVLSVETPLVRYLDLSGHIAPLTIRSPLRVLVMIASPRDYPALDVTREWQHLKEAVADLEQRGLLVVERLPLPTLGALQRQLRQNDYHIFHFIGHGGYDQQAQDGVLLLADESGNSRPISGQYLGMILHDETTLRLALLNCCEGGRTSATDPFAGVCQSLVQQGIPAVIAMQFAITDQAAITLTHAFYTALAEGLPVDSALAESRKGIFAENNDVEWGTPVLYMRTPNGQIFDVASNPNAAPASVTEHRPSTRSPQKGWQRPVALLTGLALLVMIGSLGLFFRRSNSNPPKGTAIASVVLATPLPATAIAVVMPTNTDTPIRAPTPTVASPTNPATTELTSTPQDAQATKAIPTEQKVSRLVPPPEIATPTPPTAVNVTNSVGDSIHPQLIADSASNVHLFWLDNTLRQAKGYDVLYRQRSVDGEWSDVTNLTDRYPAYDDGILLTTHDLAGNVCIFFEKYDSDMQDLNGLHLRCLINGNWSEDKWIMEAGPGITHHPAFTADATVQVVTQRALEGWRPEFAGNDLSDVFGDYVYDTVFEIDRAGGYHVAWVQSMKPGLYELKYRYSKDSGETWQPAISLSDESSIPDPYYLRSVLDGRGRVHLVWGGDDYAFYRYWMPDVGWSEINPLVRFNIDSRVSSLSVDDNDLIQGVWGGYLGEVLYWQQQVDGTWTSIIINAKRENSESVIAVGAQNSKHFAWVEKDEDIYYASLP